MSFSVKLRTPIINKCIRVSLQGLIGCKKDLPRILNLFREKSCNRGQDHGFEEVLSLTRLVSGRRYCNRLPPVECSPKDRSRGT